MLPALETLTESLPPMERTIDEHGMGVWTPEGRKDYVRRPEDDYSVVMESYEK